MIKIKKIIDLILKLVFLGVIISFIVLYIQIRVLGADVEFLLVITFTIFIIDVYLSFVFYASIASYLEKNEKTLYIGICTAIFALVMIFFIIGVVTQNPILSILIIVIGLPSLIIFPSILRQKRGPKRPKYEDIL